MFGTNWAEILSRYVTGAFGNIVLTIPGALSTQPRDPYRFEIGTSQNTQENERKYCLAHLADRPFTPNQQAIEAKLDEQRKQTEGNYEERAEAGTRMRLV